jgi:hypothetical protein
LVLLNIPVFIGFTILMTWVPGMRGPEWLAAFGGSLVIALVGAGLLFQAKWPLYRKGIFSTIGTADLPETSLMPYCWGMRLSVAGCAFSALLVAQSLLWR